MDTQNKEYDLTGNIIKFESEDMNLSETLTLFSHLIKTGLAWKLQGFYGRTARSFIEADILNMQGDLTDHGAEVLQECANEIANNYEMIVIG